MKVYVLPKESGGRPYEVLNEPLDMLDPIAMKADGYIGNMFGVIIFDNFILFKSKYGDVFMPMSSVLDITFTQ